MGIIEIIKGFIALLLLQSSWSYVGRQTLGVLFAIILLAKSQNDNIDFEPNKEQIKKRIWQKRSLNTNPYCTGVILGIALNKQREIFKESYFSLQHIFGSIGDEFFWRAFRPTLLSLAILFLLIGYLWKQQVRPDLQVAPVMFPIFKFAPLLFLIPYNIIAQGARIRGLYQGKKYGREASMFLIDDLRKPISKLYNTLSFIMGMLLVLLPLIFIYNFSNQIASLGKSIFSVISILVLVVLSFLVLRTERASSYLLIGGLLIFLVIKLL